MLKKNSLLNKVDKLTTVGSKKSNPEEVFIQNTLTIAENWKVSPLEVLNDWSIPMYNEAYNLLMIRKLEREKDDKKKGENKTLGGIRHG